MIGSLSHAHIPHFFHHMYARIFISCTCLSHTFAFHIVSLVVSQRYSIQEPSVVADGMQQSVRMSLLLSCEDAIDLGVNVFRVFQLCFVSVSDLKPRGLWDKNDAQQHTVRASPCLR